MKIIYIANARIPTEKAHGWQIIKMCESFSDSGADLELVLPTRINTKKLKETNPCDYYKVRDNFKITTLKTFDPIFLVDFVSGFYIKFQILFFIFGLLFYLLFKKHKSDYIFYCRDEQLLPFLQMFSKKVVWEAHNLPKNKKSYLKYWQKCHKIVAITKGLKNELMAIGLPTDKIMVSPDAVDLNQFLSTSESKDELRKKLNLPIDKNIILYTGHLYKWKGVETLIEASSFLSDQELVVIVGGTAKDILDFKNKTKSLKNVVIVGHLPQHEIPAYLASADILVLPNSAKSDISKTYTSPLKLFEYMAAQKPIVASALPSITEILNANNAILVEPDNPQKLAEGLKLILQNKLLSDKISKQSYNDVQAYSWHKRAKSIIDFISLNF
ncbi:MAG: glycosyltransferase [Candidatus Buchananbacteria bacterium]|nr:glycosyltransferase [Candidatus Buchananbacteria bacterium]